MSTLTKFSTKDRAQGTVMDKRDEQTTTLDELRSLIVGPEQEEIDRLRKRLEDPQLHAQDVSRVLAEAIALRTARDNQVSIALEPTIEAATKASVGRNPQHLVDALSHIVGSAIGKAISSALRRMVQSLDQIIERHFSLKGLKWRLEALQAKKPFGEIVLLHTLLYRVEQVFLIHRDTGSVLLHAAAKGLAEKDPDRVSGTLRAIQEAVQQAFRAQNGEVSDSMPMDERCVWIEKGPRAILAAIIRGSPPLELRGVLRQTIDTIHLMKSDQLASFDADVSPFQDLRGHLEGCLLSQTKEKKQKGHLRVWVLVSLIILAIALWVFSSVRQQRLWSSYVNRLRDEPGIVITGAERRSGRYYVFGLRDPRSADPKEMLKGANLDPKDVVFRLEGYRALHPEFVLARARDLLEPPETVTLHFKDGVLRAEGYAPPEWIAEARKLAKAIAGVSRFNHGGLLDPSLSPERLLIQAKKLLAPPDTVSLRIEDQVLYASGSAPHQWIAEARQRAGTVPGISRYQEEDLVDRDLQNLQMLKEHIEKQTLRFGSRSIRPAPGQGEAIRDLAIKMKQVQRSAKALGKTAHIEVIGHTDSSGDETLNLDISRRRAERVLSLLVSEGLDASALTARGVGSREPLRQEFTQADKDANRRVTFRVILENRLEQQAKP